MSHSAATIVAQLLVDQGVLEDYSSETWPVFVGHLPDGAGAPDNAACLYDTSGLKDLRVMRTGENAQKPGIQVRVRGSSYSEAWAKLEEARALLETIASGLVTIGGSTYFVRNVSQVGTAFSLGENTPSRRFDFVLNFLVTLDTIAGSLISQSTETLENVIVKTADYQLLTTDSGAVFTNTGASGPVNLTLPTWRKGVYFIFVNDADQTFQITAKTGEVIRVGGSVSDTGGNAQNADRGRFIALVALSTGEWVAQGLSGAWSVT